MRAACDGRPVFFYLLEKFDDGKDNFVSGFDSEDIKQEATDSIKSVNALYGYTPEFLEIYAQVGVVYASLNPNIAC